VNACRPAAKWTVVEYRPEFKDQVIALILKIQNVEANLDISLDQQPDLLDIDSNYANAGGNFWVALSETSRVIGTIGLKVETEFVAVLKKFFVEKEYRGAEAGVASALFKTLRAYAISRGIKTIILDTPASSARSHAFYRKAGFAQIDKSEAPIRYDYPDRDSLLFRLDC
jgi:N-acetylglutamate synthase-like GNAT family acetyltransferase